MSKQVSRHEARTTRPETKSLASRLDAELLFWCIVASICIGVLSTTSAHAGMAPTRGADSFGVDTTRSLGPNGSGQDILFRGGVTAMRGGEHNDAAMVWQYLAREGHAPSQHFLGTMYLNGWGVEESATRAYTWFVYAAHQGLPAAEYRLGLAFFRAGDVKETLKWWERAAKNAHLPAQYNLGLLYLYGLGVETNYSAASAWLKKAAERGSPGAQFYLGMMYLKGQGYDEDRQLASHWLGKSSSAGFSLSTGDIDNLKSGFVMPLFAR